MNKFMRGVTHYWTQFTLILGTIVLLVAAIPNQKGDLLLRLGVFAGYLFLYAPIIILIIYSFNSARRGVLWEGFTLKWYEDLLRMRQEVPSPLNR